MPFLPGKVFTEYLERGSYYMVAENVSTGYHEHLPYQMKCTTLLKGSTITSLAKTERSTTVVEVEGKCILEYTFASWVSQEPLADLTYSHYRHHREERRRRRWPLIIIRVYADEEKVREWVEKRPSSRKNMARATEDAWLHAEFLQKLSGAQEEVCMYIRECLEAERECALQEGVAGINATFVRAGVINRRELSRLALEHVPHHVSAIVAADLYARDAKRVIDLF